MTDTSGVSQQPSEAVPSTDVSSPADRLMFEVRWLLYPMNAGLTVALTVYLLRFFWHVGVLVVHAPAFITGAAGGDQELLVAIVDLLDQAMICSLLILTIMGGHQIYVRRFQQRLAAQGPAWLNRIDTIVLKVKLGLAFTGVSSVVLLKDCISVTPVPLQEWLTHVAIHVVFLGTTLVTAIVWQKMHPPKSGD